MGYAFYYGHFTDMVDKFIPIYVKFVLNSDLFKKNKSRQFPEHSVHCNLYFC